VLPRFNSSWIRNLNHVCRFRQQTDEPGKSTGSRVPGRCWRVHNILSDSQGAYHGDGPKPGFGEAETDKTGGNAPTEADFTDLGLPNLSDVGKLLFGPTVKVIDPLEGAES
jgi:hypothetical protein